MEYKVVPFVASLDQQKNFSTQSVADQLQKEITKHNEAGWDYVRLERVSTWVAPDNGCFGIVGAKPGYETSRQVIVFEKSK